MKLEDVRFAFDRPEQFGLESGEAPKGGHVLGRALTNHVRVSQAVLPRIDRAANLAAARLEVTDPLLVFVFASAETQASCTTDAEDPRIFIFISAALVRLLSDEELLFVIGHELGHLRFGHLRYQLDERGTNLRHLELKRAAEISADRAGLIAVGDVNIALRAILKIASGLDAASLEVDVASYIEQVRELAETVGDATILTSTHPPFPLRARALLRFKEILDQAEAGRRVDGELERLDLQVRADLEAAASGAAGNRFTEQAKSAAFWAVARQACAAGRYPMAAQAAMRAHFGDERVDALRSLLAEEGRDAGVRMLGERAESSRSALKQAPTLAERLFDEFLRTYRG